MVNTRPQLHGLPNGTPITQDTARTRKPVRHEIVERGDHAQELESAEYVIAGVFKSSTNAKRFSDGLQSLDFRTSFGYVTEKDLWYVYLMKTTTIEKARARQVNVSKMFLLRDVWLLTVE
jgi:hypothetical protein